jgi:hypothetical protein
VQPGTIANMASNMTVAYEEPEWNSAPAWKLPGWAEPVVWDLDCLVGSRANKLKDGCQHTHWIYDNHKETRLPNLRTKRLQPFG